jgi:hypothetical protein
METPTQSPSSTVTFAPTPSPAEVRHWYSALSAHNPAL